MHYYIWLLLLMLIVMMYVGTVEGFKGSERMFDPYMSKLTDHIRLSEPAHDFRPAYVKDRLNKINYDPRTGVY
jgi:hypothetical protein